MSELNSGSEDFDYSEEIELSSDGLKRLGELASLQVQVERDIAQAEECVKGLKAKLDRLAEIEIPSLMDSLGMAEARTTSGLTVSVETKIRASVSETEDPDRFQRVVDYLENHGQFRMVKNEIKVNFDKSEAVKVPELKKALVALGLKNFDQKRTINHQTISAYVRGELENGVELPESDFGVHRQRRASVTV